MKKNLPGMERLSTMKSAITNHDFLFTKQSKRPSFICGIFPTNEIFLHNKNYILEESLK